MHASHILPAANSKRVLHQGFVDWFKANRQAKYDKYKVYFKQHQEQDKTGRSLQDYPFLLKLPCNAYDVRIALLTDMYFNDALEKGLLELSIADVGDDTVTFKLPEVNTVESICRPSRTLRSPRHRVESGSPLPELDSADLLQALDDWPRRIAFELYADVWCPWCRWAEQHRIPTTPTVKTPSPKRPREEQAASVTPAV